MKSKTIKFYSDASHGWAKIDRIDLEHLNILDEISNYSYQRNKSVYLEEDSDLSIYLNALKNKYHKIEIKFNVINSQISKIRTYSPFYLSSSEKNQCTIKADLSAIKRRLDEGLEVKKVDYNLIKLAITNYLGD